MTQGFVPRFPPPEGNKPHHLPHHRAGVSTGGRLVLLLPKSAGIAKEIAMAWRDACENYNIYIYMVIIPTPLEGGDEGGLNQPFELHFFFEYIYIWKKSTNR